jgi:DHA2 family metal-tetracycline-proton antiporter-like MFS transporter
LGRKGGKLADTKGNGFVFGIGCSLLFICFVLLSSFTGVSPVWIAMFLIFGMVGQSFMYLALSNSISRTLPAEQTGVGMGLLAMLNFIAGAVSAGIYGRAVDQGADLRMTPVNPHDAAFVYSSIYLILAGVLVVVAIVYMFMFNRLNSKEKA